MSDHAAHASQEQDPVTVVVTRHVRPGREREYEAWVARLVESTEALPGFLGAQVRRGTAASSSVYTSIFRFDHLEHLQAFEASELRRRALLEVTELVEGDAVWNRMTGLELWFTPPAGTVVPQPSRFRMALVMILVVYGLVLSIGQLVALVLVDAPLSVRLLVTITIEVFLMTYVIMPQLTRLLARWIYPGRDVGGSG